MPMRRFVRDKASRTVTKAVTFRLLVLITNGIVVFLITGRTDIALQASIFTGIVNTLLYILHERLWNSVRWNTMRS